MNRVHTEISKIQNKRACILRKNNLSPLKRFRRFFIGGSCGLPLEAKHLDGLWFATIQS
jgi:hypothetical protein